MIENHIIFDFESNRDIEIGDVAVLKSPEENYGILEGKKEYIISGTGADGLCTFIMLTAFPGKRFAKMGFSIRKNDDN